MVIINTKKLLYNYFYKYKIYSASVLLISVLFPIIAQNSSISFKSFQYLFFTAWLFSLLYYTEALFMDDEKRNAIFFIASLPLKRISIVLSRYILLITNAIMSLALFSVTFYIMNLKLSPNIVFFAMYILSFFIIICSIIFPTFHRYRYEKAHFRILISMLIISFLIIFIIISNYIIGFKAIDLLIQKFGELVENKYLPVILLGTSIAFYYISFVLSVNWFNKRDL
ncbi:UNVERIFIED_CONTAM: ABC-2 family transporter [Acetivibrio alkalicellulosi]